MKLSEIGDEICQKMKNEKNSKKVRYFSKKYPMTFFEIKNFQKSDPFFSIEKESHFFEKCRLSKMSSQKISKKSNFF